MQSIGFLVLLGLFGGVAVAIQGPLSSIMGQRLGILESTFIVHAGGAVIAALPLFVWRGNNLGAWRSVPWYTLLAGGLGLAVIAVISTTIPRIGAAATVMLMVAAQLTVAAFLDHFGLLGAAVRPLDLGRLAGMVLLFVGAWLVIR